MNRNKGNGHELQTHDKSIMVADNRPPITDIRTIVLSPELVHKISIFNLYSINIRENPRRLRHLRSIF
ncbi:MAG TPA: hypothetical protein VKA34_02190 [Balneolales bacterium]|nr:hypothetical protein [Balneolales bacterium]